MKPSIEVLKRRLRTRSALAVTIESGRLAVSLMRGNDQKTEIAQSLSIPVGEEEVLRNPGKAGKELAAALGATGLRERHCVVCVPAGWALSASTELPQVDLDDLRGYLELRAEREFSMPAGELRLGFCPYTLPDGRKRATLAALPARKVEAVEQMLQAANREAVSVSLALDNVLAETAPKIHFLTNGNHVDLVVTAGGGVAGLRSLPTSLSSEEAAFDAAGFCRDVRITLGRLPEAVRQQVRGADFRGPAAWKLCTAARGGLSRIGIATPECEPALVAGEIGAATVATRTYLRRQPVAFELVVPETTRWQSMMKQFDSAKRRRLVFAAVVIVLFPLLMLFIRSRIESHLQDEWDSMESTADDLGDIQKKIQHFQPWFDPVPVGVRELENIATAFPKEGDVWAKSIQVAEDHKVTCTGYARSHPALLALMDHMRASPEIKGLQVEQIRGENPIQFTLTYQWEEQHD
ncbi:MAG TPA: PilN domain-containing protein [Chthoniobacteraceae bacterium]|nr:PilN domain-containing protein [Chthoniobacteraceae bacterium]